VEKEQICIVNAGHWDQIRGGAEYQLSLLAQELLRRGYDVSYVFLDRGKPIQKTSIVLKPLHLHKILRRIFSPYHFLLSITLFRALTTLKPTYIINRAGTALTGICAFYARRNDCKMIWHIANITDLLPVEKYTLKTGICTFVHKKLLEYGIRNADHVVAQADYQAAFLSKYYERTADLVIPNFHPRPTDTMRKTLPVKVLWICNIKPKKQPEYFIRLAKALLHRENVRFLMVGRPGNSDYQNKIDLMVAELNNIKYLGELDIESVNDLLSRCHIFVNTSQFEGFPNTFIQAWFRKVPVVSLSIDPDGVLEMEEIGFYSRSFEQLVKDVDSLAQNGRLRDQLGERAHAYAMKVHTIDPNVTRIIQLLNNDR